MSGILHNMTMSLSLLKKYFYIPSEIYMTVFFII